MKSTAFILLLLFRFTDTSAQTTIVKGAPNQIFDLDCSQCSLVVDDVALWKGIKVLPYHKTKSGMVNLLHWKYYDTILKANVVTAHELPWEACTQLIDSVGSTDTISLQINLVWTDSMAQTQRIYLLLGGLQKSELGKLPLESEFGADANAVRHFAAIVQIRYPEDKNETYESISGEIALTAFDPKTGSVSGSFEFSANCIGIVKQGLFRNGQFEKR